MAGAAPAAGPRRQSVAAARDRAMLPSAPRRAAAASRALFVLAVIACSCASATTTHHKQLNFVCKVPKSNICIKWHITTHQNAITDEDLDLKSEYLKFCGLSDLRPISPHQKFIKVRPIQDNGISGSIFCKRVAMKSGGNFSPSAVKTKLAIIKRFRRQSSFIPRGKYRGQTQSQYLSIDHGNEKGEGKAEAHSAADSSRASVSGNSGMGQAQSQSIYDPNCDECLGRSDQDSQFLKRPANQPSTVGVNGGTYPGGGIGGSGRPNQDGSLGHGNNFPGGTSETGVRYPGQTGSIPGSTYPGPGGDQFGNYPGQGGTTVPGGNYPTQGGSSNPRGNYPGQGGNTGPGGNFPGPNHGSSGTYPVQGETPGLGNTYPNQGGIYPGRRESSGPDGTSTGQRGVLGNGGVYPGQGGVLGPGATYPGQTGTGANYPGPAGNVGSGSYPIRGSGTGLGGNYPNVGGAFVPGGTYPGQGQTPGIEGKFPGQGGPGQGEISKPGNNYPGQAGVTGPGANYPGNNGAAGPGSAYPGQVGNLGPGNNFPGQGGAAGPGSEYPGQGGNYRPGKTYPGQSDTTRPEANYAGQNGNYPGQGIGSWPGGNNPVQGGNIGTGGRFPGQSPTSDGNGGRYPSQPNQQTPGNISYGPAQGSTSPNNQGTFSNNWPFIQGKFPDGTYYCCVASPNGKPQGIGPFQVGAGVPVIGTPALEGGTLGAPNNLISPVGHGQVNPELLNNNGIQGNQQQGAGSHPYQDGSRNIYPGQNSGQGTSSYPNLGGTGSVYPGQNVGKESGFYPNQGGTGAAYHRPGTGTQTVSLPQGTTGGGSTYPSQGIGSGDRSYPNQGVQGNTYPAQGTGLGSRPYPGQIESTGVNHPGQGTGVRPGTYPNQGGSGGLFPGQTTGSGTGSYPNQGSTGAGRDYPAQGIGPGTEPHPVSTNNNGKTYTDQSRNGLGTYPNQGGNGNPSGTETVGGNNYYPNQGLGTYPGVSGGGTSQGPTNGLGGSYPGIGNQAGDTFPNQAGGNYPYQAGGNYPTQTGGGYPNQAGGSYPNQAGGSYPNHAGGPNQDGGNYPNQAGGSYPNQAGGKYLNQGIGTYPIQAGGNYPNQAGGKTNQGTIGGGGNIGQIPGSTNQAPTGVYGQNSGGRGSGTGPGGQYGPGGLGTNQLGYNEGGGNGLDQAGKGNIGGSNGQFNGAPQNVLDPNTLSSIDDDSEALASVAQADNGTTASASSKGGNSKGHAQTNVLGTYTGSGSFSAQAQISDENKAAESEVNGGKQGASSKAQGSGRTNKSQANVQLGSETGAIQTHSQSDGNNHFSNSQVQGSVKGGMADSQARGPGITSSQAQIGFTPYKQGDKSHDLFKNPFVGSGTASAQSSGRIGQSQSQLHGTFKYGITYNGAAQAGASLDKDAVFPNRLNFDKINVFDEKEKNLNVNTETPPEISDGPEKLPKISEASPEKTEVMKNTESRYSNHMHADHHKETVQTPAPVGSKRSFQHNYTPNNADYDYKTEKENNSEDYDPEGAIPDNTDIEQGEYYDDLDTTHQSLQTGTHKKGLDIKQSTGGNSQHIVLDSLKNQDAYITQRSSQRPDESKVYQPGERVPGTGGYTIPIGFTGSVKSVASKDNTYVIGSKDSPSQAQSVSLKPGAGRVRYSYPSTYGKNVPSKDLRSLPDSKDSSRYVSVSKSVTRALDDKNNIQKQYSHTYYTKSSSCGYFTFTCTIVSSPDGMKKICKPKIPTNPDGTPMRC